MAYTVMAVRDLLSGLDHHSWKHQVFAEKPQSLDLKSRCIIIDTDLAELGKDDFTPLIAEQEGMQELLSIQDIRDVRAYLKNLGFEGNIQLELFAIQYYFDRDAYPTEADVLSRS